MFEQKLSELEAIERTLATERRELEALRGRVLDLPVSIAHLRTLLEEKFQTLVTGSPEFGALMRQVVPDFHVYLVRLIDGGHLLPRARVKLALGAIAHDVRHVPGIEGLLTCERTVDLFEPTQRERIRVQAMRLTAEGLEQREVAARLPERATQAAVYRALALGRRMSELGLEAPYIVVEEPPADYLKLRRHMNSKYQFELLGGYERPSL
jgi:hypothetical protein